MRFSLFSALVFLSSTVSAQTEQTLKQSIESFAPTAQHDAAGCPDLSGKYKYDPKGELVSVIKFKKTASGAEYSETQFEKGQQVETFTEVADGVRREFDGESEKEKVKLEATRLCTPGTFWSLFYEDGELMQVTAQSPAVNGISTKTYMRNEDESKTTDLLEEILARF